MKFGVNILNYGPAATPENLYAWAARAESTGFHFAMISDHVAVTGDVRRFYRPPFYDPLVTLGYLAAATTALELGTTVLILPYRHPLLTARMVANLDRLSDGRIILGVGVGWAQEEFEALRIAFDRRGAIADECLAVIRKAWSEERACFEGRFVRFSDVSTGPLPRRPPPIWVGGNSLAAMRRAVRFGDAWHPMELPAGWLEREGMPKLARTADAAGVAQPGLAPRLSLQPSRARIPDDQRLLGRGTLDQVRSDLESLAALGAEYVLFDSYDERDPDSLQGPDQHWSRFEELAERVLDLDAGTLR